jgi:hypothetical protein
MGHGSRWGRPMTGATIRSFAGRPRIGRRAFSRLLPAIVVLVGLFTAGFAVFANAGSASATCTIYWTGKTSTDWGTKANWSLTNGGSAASRTPNSTDFVCMSTNAANTAVDLSSSTTATIDGIDWPQAGSVNPSLEVDGTLTVGTKTAANASTIQALSVYGTLTSFKGEAIGTPNLTLNGDLEGTGSLTASGPATLNGAELGSQGSAATLILQGNTTLTGNEDVYFYNGSELQNQGTLTLQDSAYLASEDGNANNQLINASGATVKYSGSSSSQSATLNVPASNAGSVSVTEGTLNFGGGNGSAGSDTGTFTAAQGATLDLGGTRTEATGAAITGAGEVDITGTATFTAASNLTNTGTFEVDGQLTVSSGIKVTAANLTLDGDLEGPGSLTVSGPATLNNAYLGSAGSAATLILQGNTTLTGNEDVYFYNGSELQNQGTLTLQDSAYLASEDGNANNQLINTSQGTITYKGSHASSDVTISVPIANAGTVSVSEGIVYVNEGNGSAGPDSGTFTAASGATIDLGGTNELTSTTSVTGAGTFEISGAGTIPSGETATVGNLTLTGDLEGPGTLAVTGPATLSNAYLGSEGSAADLILQGATTVTGGEEVLFYNGSQLQNQGTLTLQDGAYFASEDGNASNLLTNAAAGAIKYSGSSSSQSATIDVPASNTGTVSVTEGTLNFGSGSGTPVSNSGTFMAAAGATLNLGGSAQLTSGTTVSGAGTFEISGIATVPSGATATVGNLTLTGDLEGPGTLTVSGPASLNNGGSLGDYGSAADLVLQGTTTVPSGDTVYLYSGSQIQNQGTLTPQDSAEIYSEDGNADNLLTNTANGTISYTGSSTSKSATIEVPVTNNGTLLAAKGTLSVDTLTNLNSGTLTGGTYETTGGTLSLPGAITTNAASIIDGQGSITNGSANALTGIQTSSGSLDVQKALTLTGALTNSGTITVEDSAMLVVAKLTQSAGTTDVVGGSTLKASQNTVAINGGKLTGTGTVTGNVAGAGTVTPVGTVAGPLTVSGTYSSVGGTLSIPISGANTAGTDYGQLSLGGAATLGGTLQIQTASGYAPPVGTTYTVLKAATINGTFANVTGTQLSNESYSVSYTATSVMLTVVANSQPAPTVTNVSPSSGTTAGGTSVTITGTGFTGATAVSFGGTAATSYAVNSSTSITASSPAESAGTVDITVTTPNGTSATSTADQFTFQTPAPTVTNVSPSSGPAGGGTSVTITGTGFTGATAVKFGNTAAASFTMQSATQIIATSPAGSGTVDITVTTPGGTSATGATDQFSYQAAPRVTSISPTSGPTDGGTSVTISGSGFTGATAVDFGAGNPATTFTINSDSSITAESPAGSGTVDVTVTSASGTSGTSSADQFEYQAPTGPTVTEVSPNVGTTAGGTTVTIAGTGFSSPETVDFGSTVAKITSATATQLVVTSPKHAAAIVNVSVITSAGTSPTTTADQFTYGNPTAAPTVTKVSPTSGPTAGGTTVTITGTNFTAGSTVQFGSNPATSAQVVSTTELTAVSPAGTAGVVDITVTSAAGTSATSTKDHFTYTNPPVPTVTKVSPTSGPTAGGTTVTITGTNFTAASTVQFGSAAATSVTYTSATKLTAVSPAGAAGVVDITVTSAAGTSATSSKDHFTFN